MVSNIILYSDTIQLSESLNYLLFGEFLPCLFDQLTAAAATAFFQLL
jgi:hypothetical protein